MVFEPKSSALIVLDVINHFADPDGRAYLPSSKAIVPRINETIDWYNKLSLPVIITTHHYCSEKELGMMGSFYKDYVRKDEYDSFLASSLNLCGKEKIINKTTYDAFWNTELESILRDCGVKQVLISGCMTHLCCETTARSAFVRGFEVYFGADLTFTKTERLHLSSLISIADGFGKILSSSDVIEKLSLKECSDDK